MTEFVVRAKVGQKAPDFEMPSTKELAGDPNAERPEPDHQLQHLESEGGGRTFDRQWRQGHRANRPRLWTSRLISRSRWEPCLDRGVRAGVLVSH